ncbi:MAG: sugar ABC transporter substrate-binding protein [Candidatus Krumholzibacteriia bacterium]
MTRARAACLCAATLLSLGAGSGCGGRDRGRTVTLRFWAMGREGEVVQELARDFSRENPDVRVEVQQIPWSAAHEKLLTGYVGRATPDLAQLGNTWIAEFAALRALEPLDARIAASPVVAPEPYFRGIWDSNVMDGVTFGVPWYVDTRLLFYRRDLLAQAGYDSVPDTWDGWRAAMLALKRAGGPDRYPLFLPLNEWQPQAVFGLQAGSPLLADGATRGAFAAPEFRRAFAFYLGLFRDGLAPPVGANDIANVYQEFARGYIAMYITGPWNLGEFRNRLPAELQDAWATAPLPGPDGPASGVSLAGGSSLVLFRGSRHKEAAWRLIEFLSRPERQAQFYRLTGDLPARREAWTDAGLSADPRARAFWRQLQRVVPTPMVPEWEQIATRLQERAEQAVRGAATPDSVLARLDGDAWRILEKRRWLIAHGRASAGGAREAAR